MTRGLVVLAAWLAACAAAAAYAAGWPTDNRIGRWVAQLGPDAGWELLIERFGGDEIALLRARAPRDGRRSSHVGDPDGGDLERGGSDSDGTDTEPFELGGPEALREWVRAAGAELEADPAVARVAHPWNVGGRGDASLGELEGRPAVRALDLASADPPRADMLVLVRAGATTEERAALARRVQRLEGEAAQLGIPLAWAGHPLVAAALDLEARRVVVVFAPLLVLLAALGVGLFLRSPPLALFAVLPSVFVSSAVRGGLRAAGVPADLILVAAGPLAFVILLASSLHLICAFRRLRTTRPPREAALMARREKLRAGALAGLTTAAGFGAFTFSGLKSVATLGWTLAIAIPLGVALIYAGLPPLLASFEAGAPSAAGRRERIAWRRLASTAFRRRIAVRVAVVALAVVTPFAILGLGTETNALQYFPPEHPARAHFAELEGAGASLSTVDVLGRANPGPWSSAALDESGLGPALGKVEGVTGVFGPEVVIAEVHATAGAFAAPLVPGLLEAAGRVDVDSEWARWTVRFPTGRDEQTQALLRRLETAASATGVHEAVVTGSVPRMLGMQGALVRTLAVSLSLTVLATTLMFLLVVRSPRELGAAVVTNLVPVATVLSAAWLLRIPLDGATVLVAALVLGLAVDNTFHVLHAGRAHDPAARAVRRRLRAFDRVGEPAAVSSAALVIGFAMLALSGFAPTARFGLLCAIGASAALAADLIVLPALWVPAPRERAVG